MISELVSISIQLSTLATNMLVNNKEFINTTVLTNNKQPIIISCDSRQVPQVVCDKWIVDNGKNDYKYYIRLTGGSKEFLVNSCTYYSNSIGLVFTYYPSNKNCR